MPVCRKPISGTALTTVSPSIVNISRSTPCVLGCCGPILMVIVSMRCPPSADWLSSTIYCVFMSCFCIRPRHWISFSYLLPLLGSRLLVLADFAAALVEFAAEWCSERLAANAGVNVVRDLAAPVRLREIKAGERIVLAQRMGRPIHGHQDTTQVGMACEENTKEIVYLALEPVRRRPDTCHGRHGRMVLASLTNAHFQA